MIHVIFRRAMILFLLICLAVHIAGLARPFSTEPLWSHIVHLISYSACLYCIVRRPGVGWVIYTLGAIYPFIYHARCTWSQYTVYHHYAAICILVVILLPAGIWLVRPRQTV
ncbi:MAG: hypothetical protein JSS76_06410 [Bacteroidetes bacterium]|nr:hypothetical protein [Bacteroidota bacterium]MBS1684366.1 hypothetical protein [Bacteroidota bacterium]